MKKFLRRLATFFSGLCILMLTALPSALDSRKTPLSSFLIIAFLVMAASAVILFLCLKMNFEADKRDSRNKPDPQQDELNQKEL